MALSLVKMRLLENLLERLPWEMLCFCRAGTAAPLTPAPPQHQGNVISHSSINQRVSDPPDLLAVSRIGDGLSQDLIPPLWAAGRASSKAEPRYPSAWHQPRGERGSGMSVPLTAWERALPRRLSSKHYISVIHRVSLIEGSWTRFGSPGKAQDWLLWEMLYSNWKETWQLQQNEIPKELFHWLLLSDPCLSPLDVWMYSRNRQYQVYNPIHRPKFLHCKLPSGEAISASIALELL